MSRCAGENDKELYRVVVQIVYPAKPDSAVERCLTRYRYYGPYRTVGAAKAMKTRETRSNHWQRAEGVTMVGWVEKTPVTWSAFEAAEGAPERRKTPRPVSTRGLPFPNPHRMRPDQ